MDRCGGVLSALLVETVLSAHWWTGCGGQESKITGGPAHAAWGRTVLVICESRESIEYNHTVRAVYIARHATLKIVTDELSFDCHRCGVPYA